MKCNTKADILIGWGPSMTYEDTYSKKLLDAKSSVRDIKLSFITGIKDVSINNSKSNVLDFIVRNGLDKYVLTGSTALKIYGLLNREIKDLDLITTVVDREGYSNQRYPIGESGRLGFIDIQDKLTLWNIFNREQYECDFFLNKDVVFREFDYFGQSLKIQEPIAILNAKIELLGKIMENSNPRNWDTLGFQKHLNDINTITKVLS